MIVRQKYLDELMAFKDRDPVKIVTSMRCSGKSTLLRMMASHLIDSGVSPERIFTFPMESIEYAGLTGYRDLYAKVMEKSRTRSGPTCSSMNSRRSRAGRSS